MGGSSGSRSCDWSVYALLRDNVQHFIESGRPGARFSALHAMESAVDEGESVVDALRLRAEIQRAAQALSQVRMEDAAVSLRTRAILTASAAQPSLRATVRARAVGWQLPTDPDGASRVIDAAHDFIDAVLELTQHSVEGETIGARREGAAPRFASAPARSSSRSKNS